MLNFKIQHHCSSYDLRPPCNPPCGDVRFIELLGQKIKSQWFNPFDPRGNQNVIVMWKAWKTYSERVYAWSDKKKMRVAKKNAEEAFKEAALKYLKYLREIGAIQP